MRDYEIDIEELSKDREFITTLRSGIRNLIVYQKNRTCLLRSAKNMYDILSEEKEGNLPLE